jgi:hypothetical protein
MATTTTIVARVAIILMDHADGIGPADGASDHLIDLISARRPIDGARATCVSRVSLTIKRLISKVVSGIDGVELPNGAAKMVRHRQ